ncbi:MAG: flagellar hook-length control protein FliK [Nitrosospira sp.]
MLNLPALNSMSSSPVSPLKNPAHATEAQEADQPAAIAGFGEVLANEMSGKDRSETGLPDEKTIPGKDSDDKVISVKGMEARNVALKKNIKENENNVVVVAAATQPMDMTELLPGLAAARTPGSRTNAGLDARTDAGIDARTDVRADTQHNDPADALASVSPSEFATAAAQPAALVAPQFSPVTARAVGIPGSTVTGTGTGTSDGIGIGIAIDTKTATAAADTGAFQNARLPSDALTTVSSGVIARIATRAGQGGVTDPTSPGTPFVINDDATIKPSRGGKQGTLPQVELGSPKFSLVGETRKTEQSMHEIAQHNLPAAQIEAGMAAAISDRSSISAASTTMAGAPVHAAPGLEPRLGAAGWDNALGQKVLWMVSNQQQVAELSLNPPDLGPLQVVLSISDDQVSAMFISQQADVRQALEAALPRLKEMMADSGINLGNTTVSADSARQQAESEQKNHSGTRYGRGNGQTISGMDTDVIAIRSGRNSLVDTFA